MFIRFFTTAALAALLAGACGAQTGASFTSYGAGCSGSGGPSVGCASLNQLCWIPWGTPIGAQRVSVPFQFSTRKAISRVWLRTRSTTGGSETASAELWETDASGLPTLRRARINFIVRPTYQDYSAFFGSVSFDADQPFAVVFDLPNVEAPFCSSGTPIFFPGSGSLASWAQQSTATPWQRISPAPWVMGFECTSLAAPRLNATPPLLGQNFAMTLHDTASRANTVFCLGGSSTSWSGLPLPLDLAPIGAPGCEILAACQATLAAQAGSTGLATARFPMPTSTALRGAEFYVQGIVLDPPANQLGLVTSNGGKAVIGEPCIPGPIGRFSESFQLTAPTLSPIMTQPLFDISAAFSGTIQEQCCGATSGCEIRGSAAISTSVRQRINFVAPLATLQKIVQWGGQAISAVTGGGVRLRANLGVWADGVDISGRLQADRNACAPETIYSGGASLTFPGLTGGIDVGGSFDVFGVSFSLDFTATAAVNGGGSFSLVNGDEIEFYVAVSDITPKFATTIPGVCVFGACVGPWAIAAETTLATPEFEVRTPPSAVPRCAGRTRLQLVATRHARASAVARRVKRCGAATEAALAPRAVDATRAGSPPLGRASNRARRSHPPTRPSRDTGTPVPRGGAGAGSSANPGPRRTRGAPPAARRACVQ
ncbi:MAG: hypothetical protein AAF628_34265 [Planctomycetota bacterium]